MSKRQLEGLSSWARSGACQYALARMPDRVEAVLAST